LTGPTNIPMHPRPTAFSHASYFFSSSALPCQERLDSPFEKDPQKPPKNTRFFLPPTCFNCSSEVPFPRIYGLKPLAHIFSLDTPSLPPGPAEAAFNDYLNLTSQPSAKRTSRAFPDLRHSWSLIPKPASFLEKSFP